MTDWPEAVREYEDAAVKLGYAYPEVEDLNELADTAIAALKAEVERLKCMVDIALQMRNDMDAWGPVTDEDRADLAARYEAEHKP